ncbi:tyrosine-protein phosphatase Lar-like [Penaeus japonicus]|uniref:tyrosine-protein phosphatase Lar-like n=1 Tax=Penaeus japonicus TaxID=27405 RepID=UPI001C70B297|nr:tyrosine-protein phosphatase Lar-like [Penaeus japonicus]
MNDRVASFTCRATGNPEPRIQWRKNGRKVSGNTRYMILNVPGGSILRIEPVKFLRDEATYECVAENTAGDTITAKAKLDVISDDHPITSSPKRAERSLLLGMTSDTKGLFSRSQSPDTRSLRTRP